LKQFFKNKYKPFIYLFWFAFFFFNCGDLYYTQITLYIFFVEMFFENDLKFFSNSFGLFFFLKSSKKLDENTWTTLIVHQQKGHCFMINHISKEREWWPKTIIVDGKISDKNSTIKNVATKKLGIENMAIKSWWRKCGDWK